MNWTQTASRKTTLMPPISITSILVTEFTKSTTGVYIGDSTQITFAIGFIIFEFKKT